MTMDNEMEMAQSVAPEDIQPGDYITALYVIVEHYPLPWERDPAAHGPGPVRTLSLPDGTLPARVVEVCLPFVLIKTAPGKHRTIDVRRYRLARVSERFGRSVFEQIGADKRAAEESPRTELKEDAAK